MCGQGKGGGAFRRAQLPSRYDWVTSKSVPVTWLLGGLSLPSLICFLCPRITIRLWACMSGVQTSRKQGREEMVRKDSGHTEDWIWF